MNDSMDEVQRWFARTSEDRNWRRVLIEGDDPGQRWNESSSEDRNVRRFFVDAQRMHAALE